MEAAVSETAAESTRATRDGVKSLLKAQNVLLDYAAKQNAIAFKFVRERMKAEESSPATALVDSVEEIVEGVMAMQRSIVDFGTSRLDREPAAPVADTMEAPAKRSLMTIPFGQLMRKNFEAAVSAQREVLGLVEKQGKLGVKAAEELGRFSAGKTFKSLASMAKESVENVIATQTSLAGLAARQGKDSIGLLADQERPLISKSIARATEEGIDNLHRTQVKLLEIARVVNARVYERAEAPAVSVAEPASTLADRLENGIERLVKTQNDLLDASLRAVNRTAPAARN
jgi:hypothetical protein